MRWSLGFVFWCAGRALVADLGEERTLRTTSDDTGRVSLDNVRMGRMLDVLTP